MNAINSWMRPAAILISLFVAQPAAAIVEPDNLGQWTKPTQTGPDQKVPGFLVNLGPTGARAILKETTLVVKHVFAGSPADGQLDVQGDRQIIGRGSLCGPRALARMDHERPHARILLNHRVNLLTH